MSKRGVCTFCGLLCGDIDFSANSAIGHCPKAATSWLSSQRSSNWAAGALERGRPIDSDKAVDGLAKLLLSSRRPLLSGLATDVAGMQQLVALAGRTSAILDHMHGAAMQTNLDLLQQTGWITTTLSEIRFRADVIVLAGDSLLDRFPRLLERLQRSEEIEGPSYFHGVNDKPASVIQLHRDPELPNRQRAFEVPIDYVCASDGSMLELVERIRRRVLNSSSQSTLSDQRPEDWQATRVADQIAQAMYSVWIWSAADFQNSGDDLILDAINDLVHRINQQHRSAVLPLAGTQGDVTAMQVCTWMTGYPLRQAFSDGSSHYDPQRYRSNSVVQRNECDLLCYISAFEPIEPSPDIWSFPGPKIVIGHPALQAAKEADYFIPAGIPGIDHTSHLFRGDSTAVLVAKSKRSALFPSVASIIKNVLKQLPDRTSSLVTTPCEG